MFAVTTLFLLYIIQCITANTTTAAQRAQQEAIAACQNLTSSTTGDGTTTNTLLFPNPSCWNSLGMTDWMSNWNTTTTICTATQSVLTPCQCRIDEPWATCFMRLTYEKNRTANYVCTNLTKPEDCTAPVPGIVVQGPVEIFYGAYSIWSLFNYLTTWYTSLTSFTALPAITHELSQTKTSALSANNLLIALVQDYAIDASLSQALVSIISKGPLFRNNDASTRPTLSNAQKLLGQLLQQALEVVTSDWACGDFQAMANGGMLLNGTLETTEILDARLGQQESK
ncbi:MAG: hypothetical protein ASARMPREDX12_000173 [Alectoria sarmentosa]|nr:MAG: hypothetical protein ASARMPREDX12_000173 [Alectoria sarmentosa]